MVKLLKQKECSAQVLEMTRLVADFINATSLNSVHGGNTRVTRHSSLKSSRFQSTATLPPPTPRMDRKYLAGIGRFSNTGEKILEFNVSLILAICHACVLRNVIRFLTLPSPNSTL